MLSQDPATKRSVFTLVDFGKAGRKADKDFDGKAAEDLLMLDALEGELRRRKALVP